MKDSTLINRPSTRLTVTTIPCYFYSRNILPPSKKFYTSHARYRLPLSCNPLFSVLLTTRMPFIRMNKAQFDARRPALFVPRPCERYKWPCGNKPQSQSQLFMGCKALEGGTTTFCRRVNTIAWDMFYTILNVRFLFI